MFINVMDAELHDDADSHPEYHHLYADLQIDLIGGEGWGYETAPGEEIGELYRATCGFRESAGRRARCSLGEGRFVLFFPGELHKPGVARPGCSKVRKAVIKIRMEDKA